MVFIAIMLSLFAGLRAIDVSQDGYNYVRMFDSVYEYQDWFNSRNELMAVYIPVTLKYLDIYSYGSIFLLFAILGVSFKIIAIYRYSLIPFLSITFYFISNFLLHEMTQIRAGVAVGILLLSIIDIYDRKLLHFLIKVGCACLFHISSLLFIPLYFISSHKINRCYYLSMLFVIIPLGTMRALNVFSLVPSLATWNAKLAAYDQLQSLSTSVNLINSTTVLNIIILLVLLFFSEELLEVNKYAIVFLKMNFISIVSLFAFSSVPVLAWRISELFSVSGFIVISYLPSLIKPRWSIITLLLMIAFGVLTLNLYRQNLVGIYHTLFY